LGMLVDPQGPPQTTLFSSARPRAYYCWLDGWNNFHNEVCKVMTNDQAYTAGMKNATGPHGTGENPKIDVPVKYNNRPKFFFLSLSLSCSACLAHPNSNPFSALSCSQICLNRQHASPNDDTYTARTSCKRCSRHRLRVLMPIPFAISHALSFPRLSLKPLSLPCLL
jgi:hypothetical protein